jgi:hypothetical protein
MERGKFREAKEAALGARTLNAQHPGIARLLADVQKHIDRKEQLDKLITDAEFYVKHEKLDEAAECYRKILGMDPGNKDAERGLKKVQREKTSLTRREMARTPIPGQRSSRTMRIVVVAAVIVVLAGAGIFLLMQPGEKVESTVPPVASKDSSSIVIEPKKLMEVQKSLAERANAGRWAPALFDSAKRAELRADRDLSARNFTAAAGSFERATTLFRSASEEAKRNETASSASLSELRTLVTNLREEMLAEKSAAQQAAATRTSSFINALADERRGNRTLDAGTKNDLMQAHTAFANAREGFKNAVADANLLARLKQDADARRTEMNQAKQNVPGQDQERRTSSSYRQALAIEGTAERMYQSGDFKGARDAYSQAGRLFGDAGTEIATARTNAKAATEAKKTLAEGGEPEKKDPARAEREAREASEREIQRMVQSYKEFLEKGDLTGLTALLRLNADGQNTWSGFFRDSEQRKVTIEDIQNDLGRGNARVSFKVRMSYYNKITNSTETPPEFTRLWTLEADNGNWKIVTQK